MNDSDARTGDLRYANNEQATGFNATMEAVMGHRMSVDRPTREMSFEEWLKLDLEDARTEWVGGKAVFYPLTNERHQDLTRFLWALLSFFVEAQGRLGRLFADSFAMRSGSRANARCPDLVFVHHDHLDRVKDTYLNGPADLVVEIISTDSARRDRVEKLAEYEADGIQEYWIIDPLAKRASFYVRGKANRFQAVLLDGGIFHSRVLPGLWLKVDWLWQEPLPLLMDVLHQWELV